MDAKRCACTNLFASMRDDNRYEHEVTCTARDGNASTCSDTRVRSTKWHVWALYILIINAPPNGRLCRGSRKAAQGPRATDDAKHPEFPGKKILCLRERKAPQDAHTVRDGIEVRPSGIAIYFP